MEYTEKAPPAERRICAAIRTIREAQGLTQTEVAERVGAPQSYMSRWERSRVPNHEDLWTIEVVGLGVPAGTVLREAGFVAKAFGESGGVEDAISTSPKLSTTEKRMLIAAYRATGE